VLDVILFAEAFSLYF